jgi:UDP-N-acetylglucosamine:LPS N-acetylglucosamine transferase
MDKSSVIFGNKIDKKTIKKASKSKRKYQKAFGDDSKKDYKLGFKPIDTLDFIGANNIVFSDQNQEFPNNALIVGNIRMGFGHYRISIAMASAAKALGYEPYWLDLASFDATGSKMIRKQNDMYSLASRISQKSKLFNHFVWEPLNSEGFKKITYNAVDQKNSELLTPIFKNIPKDIPYIATHVWPSQGAIHAGLTHVVNAIPDNWPMGLHLSEGAIHTVQTPFAYLGYKMLNGFDKKPLKGIPEADLKMVGRYVDHELLVNLEEDNKKRLERINNNKPLRILLTVGGAGAGFDMFLGMVKHLLPYVKQNKVALFINFGDHEDVYHKMIKKLPEVKQYKTFFNEYDKFKEFVKDIYNDDATGITSICNKDIFQAVYSTNLLMPVSDLLVTKPSELVYYPIPKVFMRHIGGHEVYGAVNGQELGDSTFECPKLDQINAMLDRLLSDKEILSHMVCEINRLKEAGYYNGAYECVKLAVGEKIGK